MAVDDVLRAYSRDLRVSMGSNFSGLSEENISQDYIDFKSDTLPELSRYEKWASVLGGVIKIGLSSKDRAEIEKNLERAHVNVSASEVAGLAVMTFILIMLFGGGVSLAWWSFFNEIPYLLMLLIFISAFFAAYYAYSMPERLAVVWRLKASSQMVPAILYTVIYMKHTSNLERAIGFVSKHIEAPLSTDFKRVLWDIENGKYSSIKQSLDAYLDFWKDTNPEFVESFHLIESSLYEPSEARRIQILERALKVILDEVYEKMLKYSHGIKAPLTNIYMLGIVLPTLGLALLPIAATLLQGAITSTHVFVLFNIVIPFFVFYLTSQIMLNRPGGYGETSYLEKNPLYYKYSSKKPYTIAFLIAFPFLIIGLLPWIMQIDSLTYNVDRLNADLKDNSALLKINSDYTYGELGLTFLGKEGSYFFNFLYDDSGKHTVIGGPFGTGALLLSLLVPFSFALFFSLSFTLRTKDLIKSRDSTRRLEEEFNSSLFTLGNRIGDGVPAEIAFARVAESLKGQVTSDFFRTVNTNIQTMGMGLEDAIFNDSRGAIVYFPSNLIATSMRILIESVKKGLNVAAQSLMSISEYVRNIQKINERLRDLLAEVVSDMQSNMTFLAPLLAGIIIGLAAMITSILTQLNGIGAGGAADLGLNFGNVAQLMQMFNYKVMIPPYFMQISIGIYIIQIIFILTGTLVTIDAGEDRLKQTYQIAQNLLRGFILYLIVAFISISLLAVLAEVALGGLAGLS